MTILLYILYIHSPPSQYSQSSQPSVQGDNNMGDSPLSVGVTKEIAVVVKVSSRMVKRRIGQRTPAKRVSSIPPPRKPPIPCLVTSKKQCSFYVQLLCLGLALANETLLRMIFENEMLISVVFRKLSFLSLPLLPCGLGLVSGPLLWGNRMVWSF